MSHLRRSAVGELTKKVAGRFLDNDFEVNLTFGHGKPHLRLLVTEFIPTRSTLSRFPTIVSETPDQRPDFQDEFPQPLALRDLGYDKLLKRCRDYIEDLMRYQRDVSETALATDTNKISRAVLESIVRYQKSNFREGKVCLLHGNTPTSH